MGEEKKCTRFKPVYDVILLREGVARQPDDKVIWEETLAAINAAIRLMKADQTFTVRAAKFRLRTLEASKTN